MEISAIIGGFKKGEPGVAPGMLFLGQYKKEKLVYIGSAEISSGNDFFKHLFKNLEKQMVDEPGFMGLTIKDGDVCWVEPTTVIDLSCSGWCPEAGFSKPVIERLRRDVCASEVRLAVK